MSFTIITTGRSYRLEELAAIVTASNDLSLYCEATISGERVGFQIDRATLLAGLSGLLTEVDGTPQGATSEIDFVGGTNVTLGTAFVGGKLTLTINAVAGGGGVVETVVGTAQQIAVNSTDAANPVLSLASEVTTSLGLADTALQAGDNVSELFNDAGYVTSSGGQVDSVVAGTGIAVDATDPANPIVSSTVTPGGQVDSVTGTADQIDVAGTAADPVLSLAATVNNAIADALTALQPGDNVSELTNDAGYVNAAGAASAAPIQSVTGTQVGGTASDPVIDLPTPAEIGAYPDTNPDSFITEAQVIDTARNFTKGQGTAPVVLSIVGGNVTPDLATGNAFTLDVSADYELQLPTNDRTTSWHIRCTVTGAGGYTTTTVSGYVADGGGTVTLPTVTGDKYTLFCQSYGDGTHSIAIHTDQA